MTRLTVVWTVMTHTPKSASPGTGHASAHTPMTGQIEHFWDLSRLSSRSLFAWIVTDIFPFNKNKWDRRNAACPGDLDKRKKILDVKQISVIFSALAPCPPCFRNFCDFYTHLGKVCLTIEWESYEHVRRENKPTWLATEPKESISLWFRVKTRTKSGVLITTFTAESLLMEYTKLHERLFMQVL